MNINIYVIYIFTYTKNVKLTLLTLKRNLVKQLEATLFKTLVDEGDFDKCL